MTFPNLLRASALALLIVLAGFPGALAAQAPAWVDPDDPAMCTTKLVESQMRRVAIYAAPVVAVPSDSARSAAALIFARAVTAAVAGQVRRMLGATGEELPIGEPATTWRGARTTFRVKASRDGSLEWREIPPGTATPAQTADTLLARALALVRDSGSRVPWPPHVQSATIAFDIVLDGVRFDRGGQGTAPRMAELHPLFSVLQPWMEPARSISRGRVRYPERSAGALAGGFLWLRFVVDTAGRVEIGTVNDMWPEDRPRQRGDMGDYYRSFLAAVRRGLGSTVFEPARIGGCAVKSWVQEYHDFSIVYR